LKFQRYDDVETFKNVVYDILLEDEVQNNLPISIILNSSKFNPVDWLLATVTDDRGKIALIAICTLPFNLLLYEPIGSETETVPCLETVDFLASELKRIGFVPPGVLATSELSRCFADAFCGGKNYKLKMTMKLMRLDKLIEHKEAPGFCRVLTEDDLSYTPLWEHEFCIDCGLTTYTYTDNLERIKSRLDKDIHYIWQDVEPVAQAVYGRETPNGAAINWVYTPPQYRGRGYATSVVAMLTKSLLIRGKKFCYLFADAANPASCAVYHKLGYYDVCLFDEIKFDTVV